MIQNSCVSTKSCTISNLDGICWIIGLQLNILFYVLIISYIPTIMPSASLFRQQTLLLKLSAKVLNWNQHFRIKHQNLRLTEEYFWFWGLLKKKAVASLQILKMKNAYRRLYFTARSNSDLKRTRKDNKINFQTVLKKGISKIFNSDQIRFLNGTNKIWTWLKCTIQKCLQIKYACGSRTLNRRIQKFKFLPQVFLKTLWIFLKTKFHH